MKKTKLNSVFAGISSNVTPRKKPISIQTIFVCCFCIFLTHQHHAQSWDVNLNNIKGVGKLGTLNYSPLQLFTNGIGRVTLDNDGHFIIHNLAGEGKRFLQCDENGLVQYWQGDPTYANHLLYGDGQWKPSPFEVNNDKLLFPANYKIGVGLMNPIAAMDINGDARVSNNLSVGNRITLSNGEQYAAFHFSPGNYNKPNVFSFSTGLSKSGTTGLGNTENNGTDDPDPLPDLSCLNGNISTINAFNNVVSVFAPYNSTSAGNINIGHNGTNAFIETQGSNPAGANNIPGQLFINNRCERNVIFFSDNGNPFAANQNKIMSVNGRVNISDLMQIGHSSLTNFMETSSKLYVYASGIQDGVKVRHGGVNGGAAFKAVELSDSDKGLSVYRGNQSSDGNEMFSVQGDGLTVISPANTKALSIVKNQNETFSIDKDGYTEIKVYSPAGMPNNRVLSIVDQSAQRDLFAIKSNGKVYAREVEINLLQSFPDYVFDKSYKLLSIDELEAYIKQHKHLPGFENASYYEKNGININEILIKQQEKLEELSLYIIQLENKINKQ